MIRNLLHGTGTCVKAFLFSAVALMGTSASARVEDHGALTTDSTYQLKMFVDHTFTLVAPESGLLRVRCNDGAIVVNPNLDANGKADASNNYAQNTFEEWKDEAGNRFTSVYEVYVKKGEKLYVSNLNNMSKTNFRAHIETEGMDKVSIVTRNFAENETFDISDTRYGQFTIRVNMPFAASDSAYLSVPGYPTAQQAAAGYGRLETRTDPNNNKNIRWQLKDSISDWMARGIIKGGEVITLKLNSLRSLRYGDEVYYGEDGSIEFHFTAPSQAAIHKLVDKTYPNPFLSYYVKGDESGLIKLNFDYDVMPIADGQTAKVSLRMGSAESGDVYGEEYDAMTAGQEVIKVDGKSLVIDLTGKLRTIDAMGLKMNWGSYTLRVQNVKMADGTNAYTDSKGSSGSYTITLPYREFFSTIAVQYIPDAEETLDDNEIVAYFSEKNDIDFSAVKISYQDKTTDEAKEAVIEKKDIEAIEAGENAIKYIIPITDEIKNAKNVRISYVGIIAKDGQEHPELDVRFNPGPELTATFAPTRVSPKDGAYVDGLNQLALTFTEEPVVRDANKIKVTDETTGEAVAFDAAVSGNVVLLTFTGIENLHTYSVAIADGAIGNAEFNETEGKYGNYMLAATYTFTAYHSEAALDFIPQPLDGTELTEISTVELHPNTNMNIHFSNNQNAKIWIEDAEGNKLQEASSIGEKSAEGIVVAKFEPAFKGNGQYNVVIGDSIYFYGEGFDALDPNETVRKIPYTLSAPAEKTFTVDALPASDTNVTTLSQIFLTADEPVFLNEATVTAFNQVSRQSIDGKLTKDPDTEYGAMITFDNEITDKGTWNITIPAGVFGDKTWFESQGTTGKCNDDINLYYDVTGKISQDITADPENGSTVATISTIALTFGQEIGQGYGQTAYVRDENGLRVASISSENNVELDWNNYNRATVTLSEPISAEGEYTISFPKGFFTDAEGFDIDAFELTYTIEGGDTPEPGEGVSFTATPADKAAVKSLKDITLVFDTNDLNTGSGMITVKNATTGEQIARLDAELQFPADFNDPVNTAVISLPTEITNANVEVITVEIPAGYFAMSEGESSAITLTYYVGDNATAINGVAANGQNTAVYNLNGVRVSVNAKGVKALPKGVYIIGGKKVVNK